MPKKKKDNSHFQDSLSFSFILQSPNKAHPRHNHHNVITVNWCSRMGHFGLFKKFGLKLVAIITISIILIMLMTIIIIIVCSVVRRAPSRMEQAAFTICGTFQLRLKTLQIAEQWPLVMRLIYPLLEPAVCCYPDCWPARDEPSV